MEFGMFYEVQVPRPAPPEAGPLAAIRPARRTTRCSCAHADGVRTNVRPGFKAALFPPWCHPPGPAAGVSRCPMQL